MNNLLDILVTFLILWVVLSIVAALFGAFVHPMYRTTPYMPFGDIAALIFILVLILFIIQALGIWPGFTLYKIK